VFGPFSAFVPAGSALVEGAAGLLKSNKPPRGSELTSAVDASKIGTVTSVLNGRPYKVYAGKDFGEQTFDTYLALRAKDPGRFPEIKASPLASSTPPAPTLPAPTLETGPSTAPDWNSQPGTTIPGAPADVSAGGFGAEAQKPQADPEIKDLMDLIKKGMSPEYGEQATRRAIQQYAATAAITQALGAGKDEARRRREVELERMRQWTDLQKTTLQTNLLSQAMLGTALIQAQQPNVGAAAIMNTAAQTAANALGSYKLAT
jgi:hypothetical protein